ncbi:MAG: hypothetical protein LLF94_11095 [Chlamydiales bacterium]|nr:hypothetical protein [Chlamydiales bacterium]
MSALSLNSVANVVNPANWTHESRNVAAKVVKVSVVAYAALTAVQSIPTAIAASREYVYYNCGNGAIVNALSSFGSVFYKTWDIAKAQEAFSLMYSIGSTIHKAANSQGVTDNNLILRACLAASDSLPYIYYN